MDMRDKMALAFAVKLMGDTGDWSGWFDLDPESGDTDRWDNHASVIAFAAYDLADAMLKAREVDQ